LFFFNPAVWWISRRIRIEREACVDAAAVAVTGRPIEYASLLASVAERVVSGAPMPALVGLAERGDGGTLLERVKRVVEPGVSPRVRLPWLTLFVLLLLSALVIAAVWQGTSTVVGFAQELMTDAERVERLQTAREEFAPASGPVAKGKGTIRVTVRTEDGRPLPENGWLYYRLHRESGSVIGTYAELQRELSVCLSTGTVWLLANADGYAPVYVGPFQVTADAVIEDVEIVLPLGFEASIRVTDERGLPIEGATIRGALWRRGGSMGGGAWTTDADGIAHVAHAAEGLYSITAKRPGYQPLQKKVSLSPDRSLEIQLDAARPFLGRVVSPDRQPVPDAKVRLLFQQHPNGSGNDHGNWGPTVATTDAEGRFQLNELSDRWHYVLLIDSERWGRAIVQGVAAGKQETVTIGPRLDLRGQITGPLEELERNRQGPYVVVFQQAEYRTDRPRTSTVYEKVPVRIEDGVGKFAYSRLMPGEVAIRAGEHLAKTSVGAETPSATVSIDLAEPVPVEESVRRQVVFQFVRDSQPIAIDGRVLVLGHVVEGNEHSVSETLSVADGRLAVEVAVPGHVQCRPQGMVGWYFEEVSEGVGGGGGPVRIDVPVVPAGAIQGRAALPSEYPVGELVSASVLARWEDETQRFRNRQHSISATVDGEGRFFLTPVPLGAQCSVKLTAGHNVQVSELFTLEAAEPLREVDLRLPSPVSAVVEVVDPQGRPVPDLPVDLCWEQSGAGGHVWSGSSTDREGRMVIPDVNAEVPQYHVKIPSRRNWQIVLAPLRVDGSTTRIQLERGEELTVTAIDEATGLPVPGVEIYAQRYPTSTTHFAPNLFEAEARTDAAGKARLSNLPDTKVRVGLRGMALISGDEGIVHPGRKKQLVLRGEIREWSHLHPKRPEG
jgi:5-hydroxyisourate hydrolase-like protein (transthyretin family)